MVDTGMSGCLWGLALVPTMHTYNHGDVLLLLLQKVLQELCCAAQGQVLKCVRDPMPQLQHVQPVPQSGQMDHLSVAESVEGSVDQICAGREVE